jgi:hypothetical protein
MIYEFDSGKRLSGKSEGRKYQNESYGKQSMLDFHDISPVSFAPLLHT